MDEDWDLHALVRNFTTTATSAVTTTLTNDNIGKCSIEEQNYPFPDYEENKIYFATNDFFKPNNNYNPFEELEQIYKPFYPNTNLPSSSPTISAISTSLKFIEPKLEPFHLPKINKICNPVVATRSKRRKNQQQRIVKQVTAELLSDDIWAWRKYGQKPIKGSLYPRNYYKCSSSKGCLARKQVEKSDSDPNLFILTYTGEHSHPRPTHRNSLAGSTRNKYSTTPSFSTTTTTVTEEDAKSEQIPILSPTTPFIPELQLQGNKISITGEGDGDEFEEEPIDDEEFVGEDLLIPNTTMNNEDILMGLQELNRQYYSPQSPPARIYKRKLDFILNFFNAKLV